MYNILIKKNLLIKYKLKTGYLDLKINIFGSESVSGYLIYLIFREN